MMNKDPLPQAQEAHTVKDFEKGRLNQTYTNISDKAFGSFTPVPTVTYLWVLTKDQQVIVGIEEPWNHREAFNDMTDKVWEKISSQMKIEKEELQKNDPTIYTKDYVFPKHITAGHPTLGVKFNENGLATSGEVILGGELSCKDGKWILNNVSGRYGRGECQEKVDRDTVCNALNLVAKQLLDNHQITVQIESKFLDVDKAKQKELKKELKALKEINGEGKTAEIDGPKL